MTRERSSGFTRRDTTAVATKTRTPVARHPQNASGALAWTTLGASKSRRGANATTKSPVVAQAVGQHLPHALRVAACKASPLAFDPHLARPRTHEPGGLANDVRGNRREIDARLRQAQLPALESTQLQDIVYQIEQMLTRTADLLDLFACLG